MTLVTFPRLPLQAALEAHLASLGTLDCETLRYPNAPSVTTVEPLVEAVRAAEEERAELLAAVEGLFDEQYAEAEFVLFDGPGGTGAEIRASEFLDARDAAARAAIAHARAAAAEAHP